MVASPASFQAPLCSVIASEMDALRGEAALAKWQENLAQVAQASDPGFFYVVEVQTGDFNRDDSPVCDGYWFTDEASARLWATLKEDIRPLTDAGRTKLTKYESVRRNGKYIPGGESYHTTILKGFWS